MNKRKYVFLQTAVAGIGGAQMYSIAKAVWLKEEGWDVAVVYALNSGEIVLDYSGVELRWCEMLLSRPSALPRAVVEKTIEQVASWFAAYEQIVFETNVIDYSFWGELFAERLNGVNFIFSLGEKPPMTSNQERAFYKAKYLKGELASITTSFLDALFLEHEDGYEDVVLVAHEGSAVADVPVASGFLPHDCDYSIGIVSRLEKSFVRDAVRGIADFASNHPDKIILCVCVGNRIDQSAVEFIQRAFSTVGNVRLSILGEFSPLPRKLLSSFDVVIAKSGCIDCCLESNALTIAYKIDEDVPMGVACFDIPRESRVAYNNDYSLKDYLERALIEKIYKTEVYPYRSQEVDFTSHQLFLDRLLEADRKKGGGYLTAHFPRAPFAKQVLAWITLAIGRYPNELRKDIRKIMGLANG